MGGSLRSADPAGARGCCWPRLCVRGLQPGARPSPRGSTLGRHLERCGVEGRSRITRFSAKSQSCREVLAEGFDDTSQASETGDTQASGSALGFSGSRLSPHCSADRRCGGLSDVEASNCDLAKGGEGAQGVIGTELGFSERQRR